jgi:hypothetical protein
MGAMKTELSFANLAAIETELLAVAAVDTQTSKAPDAKPAPVLLTSDEAVKSATAAVLASGEYKAGANETVLLHAPAGLAAKRLLIVGLGKQAKATVNNVRLAAGTAVRFAKPRGIRELVFALPHPAVALSDPALLPPGPCSRASVEGAILGDFDPDTYRSDRKDLSVQLFVLAAPGTEKSVVETAFAEGVIVGESQNFTRSLVNEPGNKLTPTILGQRAAEMAAEVGLDWEVHSTEKLHELKMGAFWSVSQGSAEPPALIVLRYEPAGVAKDDGGPVLGLVGQGDYVRLGRDLHQAFRQYGADEVRHGGRRGHAGRDAGHCAAEAQGAGDRDCVRGGEHARRQGAEAGRRADGDVGKDDRDYQYRCGGAAGAGRWAGVCEATGRDAPDRCCNADGRVCGGAGQGECRRVLKRR